MSVVSYVMRWLSNQTSGPRQAFLHSDEDSFLSVWRVVLHNATQLIHRLHALIHHTKYVIQVKD